MQLVNYTETELKSNVAVTKGEGLNLVFLQRLHQPNKFLKKELVDFVETIKSCAYTKAIDDVRKTSDITKKGKLKDNLPAIASGSYDKSVSNDNYRIGSSEIIFADLDKLNATKLKEFKALLITHPSVLSCFISPSGNGLKALFRVEPIRDNAHCHQVWEQVQRECLKLNPLMRLDSSGKDVGRKCFVSSDADSYINYDAVALVSDLDIEPQALVAVPPSDELSASTDLVVAAETEATLISTADEVIAKMTRMAEAHGAVGERHGMRLKLGRFLGGCIAGKLIDEELGRDIAYQLSDSKAESGVTTDKELKSLNDAILRGKNSPITKLIPKSTRDSDQDEDLRTIQENFSLYDIGGYVGIIDGRQFESIKNDTSSSGKSLSFYRKSEGALIIARFAEKHGLDFEYQEFLIHPKTHLFTDVAFSPEEQPDTTINLWRGYTSVPSSGDCEMLKSFLREVICADDEVSYEYLMSYLAHMLQKPEDKSGICVVMLGGMGIGKGTFFQLLQKIWAGSTFMSNDVDQIVGRFNAVLERSYAVLMDEGLFSGDAKSIDKFKNLITEPWIPIEQKNEPLRKMRSYHRFFAATNNDVFARTTSDDRRFFHLRVSEKYKQNDEYFTPLTNAITNGGVVDAFVYDLLNRDISNFNVRAKPNTKETTNQKKLSLKPIEKFWYEALKREDFAIRKRSYHEREYGVGLEDSSTDYVDGRFISTADLITLYLRYDKNAERFGPISSDAIAKIIKTMCPSIELARKRVDSSYGKTEQKRGRVLPPIGIARDEFAKYLNVKDLDWGEGDPIYEEEGEDLFADSIDEDMRKLLS